MHRKKLVSALNATGKECFVSYLKYFTDSQLTNEDIASIIQRERGYTFNSCRSRTSKARSILKNNRLKDALQIIIATDRTDHQCRIKVQELLNNIKSQKTKTIIRKRTPEISVSSATANNKNEISSPPASSGGATGMWSSSGLAKFELAHIFGHKQDERGLEKKVFKLFTEKAEPYGLFTSASNIVLIPKGFAKPTDHMESVKICFYKRHLDLYGNNIVGLSNFDESFVPSWYSEIKWLEPLLPDDWQSRINKLLNYRKKYLQKKYGNHAKSSA